MRPPRVRAAALLLALAAGCGGASPGTAAPAGADASATTTAGPGPSSATSAPAPTPAPGATPATASTTAPPAAPTAPAGASAGCQSPTATEGRHELAVGGTTRTYLLALPTASAAPAPVVLDFHGLGADAATEAAYSRLATDGPARGFVVATPDSANGVWTLPGLPGPDDTAFAAALLDELERTACIDPGREFAAGISNGAGLATGLICALDGRLAGVAPVAGVNIVRPCAEADATTIVAFHGTADPVIPYLGGAPLAGLDRPGQTRFAGLTETLQGVSLAAVPDAIADWAGILGCAAPSTATVAADVVAEVHGGCEGGVSVSLRTIDGGGHTWPGATPVPLLGATTSSVDATALLLDAFAAAPPRAR